MGRSSGGMTGMTSRIIHSGLLFEARNFSISSMRLRSLLSAFAPLAIILSRSSSAIVSMSTLSSSVRMASAPIPAVKDMP